MYKGGIFMKETQKSNKEIVSYIVDSTRCFVSQEKIVFAEIDRQAKQIIVPVESETFRNYLLYKIFSEEQKTSLELVNYIISLLKAKAEYDGEAITTSNRIGIKKGIFWYYLADKNNRYIRITSKGYEIVQESPIIFTKKNITSSQVIPKENKDYSLWELKKYFNVTNENDFTLLLVHIISCFIPNTSHHILIFLGNQGSAKTTASRFIKQIVDPSTIDISAIPRGKEDLILQISSSYMTVFDNISRLKEEYNDIFCQLVTGGNFMKRKLYTDSDIVAYSLQSCLILNGINYLTNQPDLLDRSIVIPLKKISSHERKTEQELFRQFKKELPYILHCIFQTVSQAKKIHRDLQIENLPRMADAVKWYCAIAKALDIDCEEFIKIYNSNRNQINQEILSENITAYALIQFMKYTPRWKGAVSELWEKLKEIIERKEISTSQPSWAKSSSALSRQLNKLKINLEEAGIFFDIVNIGNYKQISLQNKKGMVNNGTQKHNQ